jgi:hypothetical protein
MASIVLMTLLAGCNATDPSVGMPTAGVNLGTPNTADATPTDTQSTSTPAATPTQGTVSTPTSNAAVPFKLTGASAANPGNYSGICSATKTITITGTIYAPVNNAGGTATYEWVRSDNGTSGQHTVTFAPGVTAVTVTYSWALSAQQGNGTTPFWVALKTLAPEIWNSTHATFNFTCKREVSGVSVAAPPATSCITKIFAFNGTISISPGPGTGSVTVTYAWERSNGTSSPTYTVSVPAGQTTVKATPDSWVLAARGTYTDKIVTSAPNRVTSNTAKITC